MAANLERDGIWAVSSLVSAVDHGAGSTSVGCRIEVRGDKDEIVMNPEFAALLAAWCIRTHERLRQAGCATAD